MRYGQKPSSLLPTGTVNDDIALWFDTNVALRGIANEMKAREPDKGPTTTRAQAMKRIAQARADAQRMEEEASTQLH